MQTKGKKKVTEETVTCVCVGPGVGVCVCAGVGVRWCVCTTSVDWAAMGGLIVCEGRRPAALVMLYQVVSVNKGSDLGGS